MPILLAESFGYLADGSYVSGSSTAMIGGNFFSHTGTLGIVDRGNGQKWLYSVTGQTLSLATNRFSSLPTSISVGLRFYRGHTQKVSMVRVTNNYGSVLTFGVDDSGVPWVKRADGNSTTILTGTAIGAGATVYLEFSAYIHDTAGWARIYANGELDAEVTGIDTNGASGTNAYAEWITFFPPDTLYGVNAAQRFGDLIIHTDTPPIGAGANVYYVPAASEGSDADFTPSAGSDNSDMVDEIGPDEDSTHNESDGTLGHRDSFDAPGPSGLQLIRTVGVLVRARKTHEGVGALKLGVKHGSSESQGSAKGLSVGYQNFVHYADQNPATSSDWTAAEAAEAEISYEVP